MYFNEERFHRDVTGFTGLLPVLVDVMKCILLICPTRTIYLMFDCELGNLHGIEIVKFRTKKSAPK